MPAGKDLTEPVFRSIIDSSYPESENVVSAELESPALQDLSKLLEQARSDVKTSISELSKLSATDIDGWIGQAKQLRTDIDGSLRQSRGILDFAAQAEELHEKAKVAAKQVSFLRNETAFNTTLVDTFKSVQSLKQSTDTAQQALHADELLRATQLLSESRDRLKALKRCERTRVVDLVSSRLDDIQNATSAKLEESWSGLVHLNVVDPSISIYETLESSSGSLTLSAVVESLATLGLLQASIVSLRRYFERTILRPCLHVHPDGELSSIIVEGNTLRLTAAPLKKPISTYFSDIGAALGFLASRLPHSVASPLVEALLLHAIPMLLSGPLAAAVPTELDGISIFRNTLVKATEFADLLESHGWYGHKELLQWVHDAPNIWLMRRSQSSLKSIRQLLEVGLGNSRSVERVETQRISNQDNVFADNTKQADWSAEWSDEESAAAQLQARAPAVSGANVDDDEDVSGWGFDDAEVEMEHKSEGHGQNNDLTSNNDDDDESDAWGWGDEDEDQPKTPFLAKEAAARRKPPKRKQGSPARTANGSGEREVTLRETYYITSLPERILEIIVVAAEDADALARVDISSNPVAAAAKGLYALPGSLLSMFRANSPNIYGNHMNGNMYLFNDSLYIAEQLRSFAQHHSSTRQLASGAGVLDLGDEIAALELFGKRAYGREMQLQRTILTDLLDGAQGFANCTESPFAQECDVAVSSIIDRIRELHKQWSAVLAKSAVLQSVGSLLTTVTNKMILDIEDMSNISEPESQRLASFCNSITALDELFLPEQVAHTNQDEQSIPLTAGYASTWLKFQYLANILESSLVDIKYLWTEGELSLEFSTEEVVDLIEALFVDSDHRRKAIQEIRRGANR